MTSKQLFGITAPDGSQYVTLTDGAGNLVSTGISTRASKTSNYPITAADTGTQFDNAGAGGEVDFTLPTASKGLHYGFIVAAAQTLKVIAGTGATIAIGASISASAGNISANAKYAAVQLEAISATEWVATSGAAGTWTVT